MTGACDCGADLIGGAHHPLCPLGAVDRMRPRHWLLAFLIACLAVLAIMVALIRALAPLALEPPVGAELTPAAAAACPSSRAPLPPPHPWQAPRPLLEHDPRRIA